MSDLNIFGYSDYRKFLKERVAFLKGQRSKVSYRFIAQRLGIHGTGWFADILAGRKSLQHQHILPLGEVLGLAEREQEYLEALVAYNEATGLAEREKAFSELVHFHEVPAEWVDRDRFAYFSQWYHSVIRELILMEGWDGRPQSLSRRLNPPVPVEQVKESLALLQQMGFLRKLAGGRWEVATPHVRKQVSEFGKVHYYQFIRNAIQLGQRATERWEPSERDVSALVLPLDHAAFAQAREKVADLRREIIALSEESLERLARQQVGKGGVGGAPPQSGEIFQFLFQAYPVTGGPLEQQVGGK